MERGGEAVSGRIHVIHCGIPIKDWTFVEPRDVVSPLRILSVGALIEKKGHDSLIRACAFLKKQGMPFECRIVGAGPLEAELSALVAQFGLHSVVQLVGPQPQERIRAELANADVFVLASRTTADGDTDGIPVSLMEAMALGIGVVSTKVAGIPELVKDEVTGFLAEEGDVPALANSILRAAQDGFERRQRVLAARYVIEQHFNADVESGKLATLLTRSALTATAGAWSASPSQDRCGAP